MIPRPATAERTSPRTRRRSCRRAIAAAAALLGVAIGGVAVPSSATGRTNGSAELSARRILDARQRVDDAALAIVVTTTRFDRLGADVAATEQVLAEAVGAAAQRSSGRHSAGSHSAGSPVGRPAGVRAPAAHTSTPAGVAGPERSIGADRVHGEFGRVLRRELLVKRRAHESARREVLAWRDVLGHALVQLADVEAHHLPDTAVERELARQGAPRRAHVAAAARAARARLAPEHEAPPTGEGPASNAVAQPAPTDAMVAAASCPVGGPADFVDTWGAPRSGGRRHLGVDMMAATGTPVLAVESGHARFTTSRLGGRTIWLSGESGTSYFYAHLESWEGMSRPVVAGEVIGFVGESGNAWTPHLHFEVHPDDGRAVRPYPYVRDAC